MASIAFPPSPPNSFILPDFYNFKPFFTLQPVIATRQKQLKLWRELIIQYHISTNIFTMIPSTFHLFRNDVIDRALSLDGIAAVVESLILCG